MEAQMEEEQVMVSLNIYNDQANMDSRENNDNRSHDCSNGNALWMQSDIEYPPENYGYESDRKFTKGYCTEETRGVSIPTASRPVVCVADEVHWDYAMLTMVQPAINYPKLVQAKTSTSLPRPPANKGSHRTPAYTTPTEMHVPYVERKGNFGKPNMEASIWHPVTRSPEESTVKPLWEPLNAGIELPTTLERDGGEEMVRALQQVVSTPRIKYMHFDGDLVNYITFIHNFETCLEKDNPDSATRLIAAFNSTLHWKGPRGN